MTISSNLASQFAKVTNDSNKQKEETVYGTVVTYQGKLYVNLDGSDSITPIVTTAEIKAGERVAVMIKGHTATVIGNITNPGTSQETTGKILDEYDVIVAKIGDFELIIADKITTGQLEAELAIIEELIAKKATIEELNAVKATIEDLDVSHLEAELAEIEKLIATKAEIEDLEAVHATIEILEAGLAEIDTLIGGNLTMDNIQSLVLTTSKVTVDNAFIKDAMIDRVSASKLSAGSINTNLIQIGSEDGSMAINGSLQQFKDADGNVRIQIGKDTTGDFTFALYGEDGQGQLINQNGITASAIGDGLIVDDMVADDAHISGGKLDISSVITEINNNTTTINASRIYLDNENQSLSVAFNSLKDTVETIKDVNLDADVSALLTKIEAITTELNVAQGEIDTLVSNSTIVTQDGKTVLLKDDYTSTKQTVNSINTKVSSLETTASEVVSKQVELEQNLDGFELSVRNAYATKDELNSLEISGRNLVRNSTANLGDKSHWTGGGHTVGTGYGNMNSLYLSRTGATSGASRVFLSQYLVENVMDGENICISGWYYVDSSIPLNGTSNNLYVRLYSADGSAHTDVCKIDIPPNSTTNTWIRFEKAEKISTNHTGRTQFALAIGLNGMIRLSGLKVEKGSKATAWSPALEDTNDQLDDFYTKTETDSKLSVLSDSISMKVSSTEVINAINNINVGGRNLLKKSNDDITNATYNIANYYFGDEKPALGEEYTITLKGTLGSDRTSFGAYNSGGYVNIGTLASIGGGLYRLTGTWKTATSDGSFTADNTHLRIYQLTNKGTSESTIEWIKMEKGNKATDWSPAPEDVDDKFSETEQNMHDNIDNAVQDGVNNAMQSVDDLYARKDTFESFQSSVQSQFEQTSKDIQMTFSEAILATDTVNGNLETYKAQVESYIRFDTNGMEMGKSDSPFKSKLTNQKLAFTQGGTEVAYISDNKLYITEAEILNTMALGKWVWTIGSNGNLSLNWRG